METIHPNDIQELDADTFSFITLKNGNMIMIDDSVPEKPKTTKRKNNEEQQSNNEKKPQNLMVSEQLEISFKGEEQMNNNNLGLLENKINNDNSDNKIIVKSDFNLVSHIDYNTNFSFLGKPNQNKINNIPSLPIHKNENQLLNSNNDNNYDSSNRSNNINTNQKLLLNDKLKDSQNENESNNSSTNRVNTNNNEENKEEEIRSKIRRKSRNFIDKIEKMVGDRNRHTAKAVISLYIPSDVSREFSKTQKQFNLLVAQLRQKQSKYRSIKKNEMINQRYYELYKDKNSKIYNSVLGPHTNRIKYYEEAEAEDFGDISLIGNDIKNGNSFNSNSINNNVLINNNHSNTFYGGLNNNNMNKSINFNMVNSSNDFNLNKSINSFSGNRTRPLSESKFFNNKVVGRSLGYSSALIYPSNHFLSKLGHY